MAAEVERKFIVEELPPADVLGPGEHLRQGYVAEDHGVELRVRISEVAAVLTVKAGSGLSRTEVEAEVSHDQAESLWPFTEGRRIDKTRHRVDLGPVSAEVDIYDGALAGLLVVEVEFESEELARSFDPPPWFGPEVTGQIEWSNAALARNGKPR